MQYVNLTFLINLQIAKIKYFCESKINFVHLIFQWRKVYLSSKFVLHVDLFVMFAADISSLLSWLPVCMIDITLRARCRALLEVQNLKQYKGPLVFHVA